MEGCKVRLLGWTDSTEQTLEPKCPDSGWGRGPSALSWVGVLRVCSPSHVPSHSKCTHPGLRTCMSQNDPRSSPTSSHMLISPKVNFLLSHMGTLMPPHQVLMKSTWKGWWIAQQTSSRHCMNSCCIWLISASAWMSLLQEAFSGFPPLITQGWIKSLFSVPP